MSQARLGEDEEEEVTPPPAPTGGGNRPTGTAAAGSGAGPAKAAAGAGGGGADGFTLTDAPQEMDVNMEYKELAREGDGDDADPDVMMGTQPGGMLKNVAFRVKNRQEEVALYQSHTAVFTCVTRSERTNASQAAVFSLFVCSAVAPLSNVLPVCCGGIPCARAPQRWAGGGCFGELSSCGRRALL